MKLTQDASFLSDYWRQFGETSSYEVLISASKGQPLIVTKSGDKVVGHVFRFEGGGFLVLLPFIDLRLDAFFDEEAEEGEESGDDGVSTDITWSVKGKDFGRRFCGSLLAVDHNLHSTAPQTP